MIVEHALLPVKPGREAEFEDAMAAALPLIQCQPGFLWVQVSRCEEKPSTYLLLVGWENVEAHENGFRKSTEYQEWRALLHHFYEPFPEVGHFKPTHGISG
jgi:heme-degrading monooxygenase HmoA